MRKALLITVTILFILAGALIAWYFFSREDGEQLGDFIYNSLPFGSGDGLINIPFEPPSEFEPADPSGNTFDEFGNAASGLFRISDKPVAGTVALTRNSQTVVRYVERDTGHIFEVLLPTDAAAGALEKTRITNNTLPKIYEAHFRPDGNAVVVRSLREDWDLTENMSLVLTPPLAASGDFETFHSVSATSLRGNMDSLIAGPGNSLSYVLKDASSISISNFDGTGARNIFSSSITDWRLARSGNNLVAYTKASSLASGYAYSLNASNGAYAKILGPLIALVVTPNAAGNRLLYSYIDGSATRLVATNAQGQLISELMPATLAEKCVWSSREADIVFCGTPLEGIGTSEPDNWYRGRTHFSDRIWKYNVNLEIAEILVEPLAALGVDVDVYEPRLPPNEDYLIFTNKNDLSLWAIRL